MSAVPWTARFLPVTRLTLRWTLLFASAAVVASWIFFGGPEAAAIAAGVGLGLLQILWLDQSVGLVMGRIAPPRTRPGKMLEGMKFFLRWLLLGAALYVILSRRPEAALPLAGGMALCYACLLGAGLRTAKLDTTS